MQSLDEIVREYMIEKGDQTQHSYARLLSLGIRGLRELNLDVSGVPKMVVLPVKDNLTVDLPQDYIRYVRIGMCDASGQVQSLGLNNDLCLPRSADDCGNPKIGVHKTTSHSNLQSLTSDFLTTSNYSEGTTSHYRNSEFIGRLYGIGGGNNNLGSYRIDHERNAIQFDSNVASSIVLEYISDFTMADGTFMVHPFITEALLAYIAWADIRRKKNTSKQDSELARRDYFLAKHNSERRYSSVNIAEAMQALRKGFKLSPKL